MSAGNVFDVTGNDCHNFKFRWDINNFFMYDYPELFSPVFSVVQNSSIKWKIIVDFVRETYEQYTYRTQHEDLLHVRVQHPNERSARSKRKSPNFGGSTVRVGLLKVTSVQSGDIKAFFSFELCRFNGEIIRKESSELNFSEQETKCFVGTTAQPVTKVSLPEQKSSGVEDCITIKGNIHIENCHPGKKLDAEIINENLPQLQCDFKAFFQNQQFTDAVLNVGGEVIHAHKFVLCARSPVFRKMFEHNMKESRECSVQITDFDRSVIDTFLIFLYTGVIEDRQFSTVVALYSVADKYEVKTLQKSCSNLLTTYISASTVCVILKLADMHGDDDLKESAVEFICNNFVTVETSSQWRSLVDSEPRLASYTLRRVSSSVAKK